MLSHQVHSAWDLTKVKKIENTTAEDGDVKISFADFWNNWSLHKRK